MFASVEVVLLEKPQTLVIPREAILEAKNEMCVFVVEGKQAVRRPITIGYEQDHMVEVLKGLNQGDQVIIKGQQMIENGTAMRVVEGS